MSAGTPAEAREERYLPTNGRTTGLGVVTAPIMPDDVLINSKQPDPDLLGSWLISSLERDR